MIEGYLSNIVDMKKRCGLSENYFKVIFGHLPFNAVMWIIFKNINYDKLHSYSLLRIFNGWLSCRHRVIQLILDKKQCNVFTLKFKRHSVIFLNLSVKSISGSSSSTLKRIFSKNWCSDARMDVLSHWIDPRQVLWCSCSARPESFILFSW